jgi:hypothetical protein
MWLKRRMVEAAEAEAMSFTEWTKLALRLAVESSEAKRHPKRR